MEVSDWPREGMNWPIAAASQSVPSPCNTHTHIKQLNIFHHFFSLLTPTSIINWKAKQYKYIKKAIQKVQSNSNAFVDNLALRWCHLHELEIWPPGGATCISKKFGHHKVPPVMVSTHGSVVPLAMFGSSVSINCVFSSIKVISASCSTLVINWGHQQGSSTRVIN